MSLLNPAAPRQGWFNVTLLGFAHFVSDFFSNVLPVMLPILAARFSLSYSQCAVVFMVFSVTMNLIQPPIGLMADRFRVNILMPLSVVSGALLACLLGVCDHLYVVMLVVLLAGLCQSGFHPIAGAILPTVTPVRHEEIATSIFIAGGNLGFAVAPPLIALYIDACGERALPWVAVLALLCGALIMKRRLHHNPPVVSAAPAAAGAHLGHRQLWWFIAAIGLRSWSYCALLVYLPLLLEAAGQSAVHGAGALMVMLLGTVAGGLAAGTLAAHFSLKRVIALSFMLAIAAESWYLWDPTAPSALVALFIAGAAIYGSTPVAIVWTRRLLPAHTAGLATSLMLGMTFGLGYVFTVITGIMGDLMGLRAGLAITILPSMLAALFIVAALRNPRPAAQIPAAP